MEKGAVGSRIKHGPFLLDDFSFFFCFHRDIVIPKSRAVQQNRRMRTETSVDTEDDDAFFDSEDDDEDQDESK